MRQILTCLILIGLLCTGDLYATDNGKKETIRRLRQEFARHISGTPVTNYTLAESLSLIDADGRFTDSARKRRSLSATTMPPEPTWRTVSKSTT